MVESDHKSADVPSGPVAVNQLPGIVHEDHIPAVVELLVLEGRSRSHLYTLSVAHHSDARYSSVAGGLYTHMVSFDDKE